MNGRAKSAYHVLVTAVKDQLMGKTPKTPKNEDLSSDQIRSLLNLTIAERHQRFRYIWDQIGKVKAPYRVRVLAAKDQVKPSQNSQGLDTQVQSRVLHPVLPESKEGRNEVPMGDAIPEDSHNLSNVQICSLLSLHTKERRRRAPSVFNKVGQPYSAYEEIIFQERCHLAELNGKNAPDQSAGSFKRRLGRSGDGRWYGNSSVKGEAMGWDIPFSTGENLFARQIESLWTSVEDKNERYARGTSIVVGHGEARGSPKAKVAHIVEALEARIEETSHLHTPQVLITRQLIPPVPQPSNAQKFVPTVPQSLVAQQSISDGSKLAAVPSSPPVRVREPLFDEVSMDLRDVLLNYHEERLQRLELEKCLNEHRFFLSKTLDGKDKFQQQIPLEEEYLEQQLADKLREELSATRFETEWIKKMNEFLDMLQPQQGQPSPAPAKQIDILPLPTPVVSKMSLKAYDKHLSEMVPKLAEHINFQQFEKNFILCFDVGRELVQNSRKHGNRSLRRYHHNRSLVQSLFDLLKSNAPRYFAPKRAEKTCLRILAVVGICHGCIFEPAFLLSTLDRLLDDMRSIFSKSTTFARIYYCS